jgi:hypothetical protein
MITLGVTKNWTLDKNGKAITHIDLFGTITRTALVVIASQHIQLESLRTSIDTAVGATDRGGFEVYSHFDSFVVCDASLACEDQPVKLDFGDF